MKNILLTSILFWSNFIFCQEINTIPEVSLYFFYEYYISENSESIGIIYPEKTKTNYTSYYSKNKSKPYLIGYYEPGKYSDSQIDSIEESLKKHITLKIIDDKIKTKRIFNPYQINPTKNNKVKINKNGSFYLPINNNKDSIYYEATKTIEAYTQDFKYIGEIKVLNKYVVYSFFELPEYLLIDKLTGATTTVSSGFPNYSPNKNYLIDLIPNTATYQHNESAQLLVSFFDKKNYKYKLLSANFKSWAPSSNPYDYFWVSNNEFVFKAFPIRKYVNAIDKNKLKSQYIKLTIVEPL